MFAVTAVSQDPDNPTAGLRMGEHPDPEPLPGWVRVRVRAAAVNHHDVWSLRGVGLPADRLPMILGCDAAGELDDGTPVVVHSVISSPGWTGDETLDPKRTLLSERHPGTFAEWVCVPEQNVVAKPAELTFEQAACLPTAWLTAYRMLFSQSGCTPGDTVLVQGAGGGVSTAAIALGRAAGLRVWVTSRDAHKRDDAVRAGADRAFEPGARLPERVDAVIETVGAATWSHSLKSLRPGGTVVVAGATSGAQPDADLQRVFFLQLRIQGSTMGTRAELERLLQFCVTSGVRPTIAAEHPLAQADQALQRLVDGNVTGKVVLTV